MVRWLGCQNPKALLRNLLPEAGARHKQKPQYSAPTLQATPRKDEMSEDVRHLCTERVKARHRLCESHAYVQSGKEMVRRDHDFPKTKQAKSECEPRSQSRSIWRVIHLTRTNRATGGNGAQPVQAGCVTLEPVRSSALVRPLRFSVHGLQASSSSVAHRAARPVLQPA